jgi:hypothetical protein
MSDGISISFVDFAAFSSEIDRCLLRFDEIVSGARLVRREISRTLPGAEADTCRLIEAG